MADRIEAAYGKKAQGYDALAERMKENQEKTQEKQTGKKEQEEVSGVVYEKSGKDTADKDAIYSVMKKNPQDRAQIVEQLKAAQEERERQLADLVQKTISGQASAWGKANNNEDMWRVLSSGKLQVDAATRAQAQRDIGEDGYWGVKQTSQRLFDFASALAGDDVDKMHKMQSAMEKGFRQATGAWGKKLPDICQQTFDKANSLFEDYYKSKEDEKKIEIQANTKPVQG